MTATKRKNISYLIIGSGRLARHLLHYFHLLKENSLQQSLPDSSDEPNSAWTLDHWDRAQDPLALARKVDAATHILLAISDDSLESFFQKNLNGHDKVFVHFSGAKQISGMIAAHPLMTFSHELYNLEHYQKIHFVMTGADNLQEVLPHFLNSSSVLFSAEKAKYHALCVLGGNFSNLLISKMLQDFEAYGIPQEASRLYIDTVINNVFMEQGQSLTGPLARKDSKTVSANLKSLEADPYKEVYESFVKVHFPEFEGLSEKDKT